MNSILKYKIKKYVPSSFWDKMSSLLSHRKDIEFKESNFCFGSKNSKIKVLIIRRRPPGGGLFSNINHVLQGVIHASERNMVPVVDMKNYATEYSAFRKFNGTNNAWEYFFEQVSNIHLDEAYSSKNVTLSKGDRIIEAGSMAGRNLNFAFDLEKIEYLNSVHKKHIKLNSFTISYIDYINKIFEIETKNTLGVFLRGNEYVLSPTTGHPKQPKIDEVIRDVQQYLDDKAISKIFLSTDDPTIRAIFNTKFADLIYPNIRIDYENDFAVSTRKAFKIPKGALAKNLSYLSEIYTLSKLEYNIASLSNGSAILHVINGGKFKDSKLYNLGVN